MLKKITSRVEFLGFFIYLCAMDNLKNFIVKNKYDLLLNKFLESSNMLEDNETEQMKRFLNVAENTIRGKF